MLCDFESGVGIGGGDRSEQKKGEDPGEDLGRKACDDVARRRQSSWTR